MIFTETQKFSAWVLWLMRICFVIFVLAFYFAYSQGVLVSPFVPLIIVLISAPLFLILEFMSLKTRFDKKGIELSFKPFTQKSYNWPDIQTAELVDYGFIGGWGIRKSCEYGTVYNTQGQEGVLLTFKNGKKVLIGTQRKAALQNALKKYFNK